MEADISSLSFQTIHADNLIWSQNSIITQHQSLIKKQQNSFPIDQKNLKNTTTKYQHSPVQDKFILAHIKPDYGSLGQFITDIGLNTDIFKQKKKKFQGQQQLQQQQKKIRQQIRNKNLNKILSNKQTSTIQRNVACKLLIQKTFEQAFGCNINRFYQEEIKQYTEQKKTLNLSNLSKALDQIVTQSKGQKKDVEDNSFLFLKQTLRKNRSLMKNHTFYNHQKQNIMKRITQTKDNYRILIKINIPDEQPPMYKQLYEKYGAAFNNYNNNSKFHQNNNTNSNNIDQISFSLAFAADNQNKRNSFTVKAFQSKIIRITQKQFILNNLYELNNQTILYALKKTAFQTLQVFSIMNTSFMTNQMLFLILDLLAKYSKNLKYFVLEDLVIKSTEKLSSKIKLIIQSNPNTLEILRLNKLGIETKDFCVLCLGIGSSIKLEKVQMKNNKIDQHGKKSYDVIMKFFKKLEINLEGNGLHHQILNEKEKSLGIIKKNSRIK